MRFCLTALILAVLAGMAGAQTRGAFVLETTDSGPVELYERSYALVIGIDAYSAGWPRLSNAVRDAQAVADDLGRRGFEVTLLTDLGSDALENAIEDFIYGHGEDESSRLLIWYAGHGHMIGDEAYLVPADAPAPDQDARFRRMALSLRDFGKYMREVRSRHVLAIFDSCFSGNVFETARALPSPEVTRATSLPVRQMISSGDAGQTVSDNGAFRKLFLDALSGDEPNADANHDGYLTGSELGLFLSDKVTSLTLSRQTPRYGKLRELGYDRGDFVFQVEPVPEGTVPVVAAPAAPPPAVVPDVRQGGMTPPEAPPAGMLPPSPGKGEIASADPVQGGVQQRAVMPPVSALPFLPGAPAPEGAVPQLANGAVSLTPGSTVEAQGGRLSLTVLGNPYGGRRDLLGLSLNGETAGLGLGGHVTADADDAGCRVTLLKVGEREAASDLLVDCGPPTDPARKANAALSVALADPPGTRSMLRMIAGETQVLMDGRLTVSMLGNPYGGRRDLVGMSLNGQTVGVPLGGHVVADGATDGCVLRVADFDGKADRYVMVMNCGGRAGTALSNAAALHLDLPAPPSASEAVTWAESEAPVLLGARLVFALLGNPYGGRRDLVGVRLNGEAAGLSLGGNLVVEAPDVRCTVILTAVKPDIGGGDFLWQCDPPGSGARAADPVLTVKLGAPPSLKEEIRLTGGATQLVRQGTVVMAMLGTPYGGRRDLVGIVVDGEKMGLGLGQEYVLPGTECRIAVVGQDTKADSAAFLLTCP